jgi:regulator of protease activity HflC (stomatin/prohibitin superfamily)
MAEILSFLFLRHLRSDPSAHVLRYRKGNLRAAGRGLAFWFRPMSTAVAEVPVNDRELDFLFHGRTLDYQDVSAQGVISYRIEDATRVADRVDFSIDLTTGRHLREPLEKIALVLNQIAQQHAWAYMAKAPVRDVLADGYDRIRDRVLAGLREDDGLTDLGIQIVSVRISAVRPTPDLEKALETPMRERLQQAADEATFQRRALAVEKERAIAEAELQNQIELAHREQDLIAQRGKNERRRVIDDADARKLEGDATADRARVEATAKADGVRVIESARVEAERDRMTVYRDLPTPVLLGLAARELAGKLTRIDHLNLSPDVLGPGLLRLLDAGTKRLGAEES